MKKVDINLHSSEKLFVENMEVLSIGEKIKKLRIQKGIRLKDICSENLSISKISCIENSKIKADEASLKVLADKLGTSYEYLSKDIATQIWENISSFCIGDLDIFEKYKYNLDVAINQGSYGLVFEICSYMFNEFIFKNGSNVYVNKMFEIIPIYFNSLTKIGGISNGIIYNLDLAVYFLVRQDYYMASYYFEFLRKFSHKYSVLKPYRDMIIVNEMNCYINLRNYDKLYLLKDLIEIRNLKNFEYMYDFVYFNIVYNIKYNSKCFDVKDVFEIFNGCDLETKIRYLYKIKSILYEMGYLNECIYICENLYLMFKDITDKKYIYLICKILVKISKFYIENMKISELEDIIEYSLNLSITNEYDEFTYELYFYKAIIYMTKNDLNKLSIYVDLCEHFLSKINVNTFYEKYLNIGFMFCKLDDIHGAIKNFNLILR